MDDLLCKSQILGLPKSLDFFRRNLNYSVPIKCCDVLHEPKFWNVNNFFKINTGELRPSRFYVPAWESQHSEFTDRNIEFPYPQDPLVFIQNMNEWSVIKNTGNIHQWNFTRRCFLWSREWNRHCPEIPVVSFFWKIGGLLYLHWYQALKGKNLPTIELKYSNADDLLATFNDLPKLFFADSSDFF